MKKIEILKAAVLSLSGPGDRVSASEKNRQLKWLTQ